LIEQIAVDLAAVRMRADAAFAAHGLNALTRARRRQRPTALCSVARDCRRSIHPPALCSNTRSVARYRGINADATLPVGNASLSDYKVFCLPIFSLFVWLLVITNPAT
jgi:hypothetical protein